MIPNRAMHHFFFLLVRPRIKPLRMVNRDKFPEIRREDCESFRVIDSKIFPSMNTLLYINILNHHKLILHLIITSNKL